MASEKPPFDAQADTDIYGCPNRSSCTSLPFPSRGTFCNVLCSAALLFAFEQVGQVDKQWLASQCLLSHSHVQCYSPTVSRTCATYVLVLPVAMISVFITMACEGLTGSCCVESSFSQKLIIERNLDTKWQWIVARLISVRLGLWRMSSGVNVSRDTLYTLNHS